MSLLAPFTPAVWVIEISWSWHDAVIFAVVVLALAVCFWRIRYWSGRVRTDWGAHKEPLQIVCGWCKATLQTGRKPTSHGICAACQAIHFPDSSRAIRKAMAAGKN